VGEFTVRQLFVPSLKWPFKFEVYPEYEYAG
jgi:hypothetical protein